MLVAHPSRIVDGALTPLGRDEPINYAAGALAFPVDPNGVRAFGHQMMFRRDVLEAMIAIRPLADRLSQTGLPASFDRFIPFCACLIGDVAILPEPLVLFRRHGRATSGAGKEAGPAHGSTAARASYAIARDLAEVRDAAAVAGAAIDSHVVHSRAKRVLKGLRARERTLWKLATLAGRGSRVRRLFELPDAMVSALRPTGFSNSRRVHTALVAAAAAVGR